MSVIIMWPAELPSFSAENFKTGSYTEQYEDNLVKNETGVGPPKTRPRATAARKKISFTITLTDTQKNTLQTFFNTSLSSGSAEFQHHLPDDSSTQVIYKFRSPPSFQKVDLDVWEVRVFLYVIRTV